MIKTFQLQDLGSEMESTNSVKMMIKVGQYNIKAKQGMYMVRNPLGGGRSEITKVVPCKTLV